MAQKKEKSERIINVLTLALGVANALVLALADKRITAPEIVALINAILAGLGAELAPLGAKDVKVKVTPAGGITISLSRNLAERLQVSF